jgi:serine/threonine protein kinase
VALAEGTRLGPYRVGPLIGAGGMGEVYRARDERLGREVAVKVVSSGAAPDPEVLRRFEQEARAASALNHPGILSVFDLGVHEGLPYVVCELLEGQTLRDLLRGGALPQRRAVDIGVQVAQALAAAHDKGIVHRDLKPENLFVIRDGRVKILDFGLAKLVRRQTPGQDATGSIQPDEVGTRPGTVMGTVGYMSPEQVRGNVTDHRSDIFSFGAVLYEMIGGHRAFRGASAVETMSAILKEDPPELAAVADRLVRRCLEKAPERRFQSASDLAFALEALSSTSQSAAVAPPQRRRGRILAAMAAAAALLAAGAVVLATGGFRAQPPDRASTRLTFRRGVVSVARFTPDGQSAVYSARWDSEGSQLYSLRLDNPVSTTLPVPPARLLSVSSQGEMLVLLDGKGRRTLARVPLAGGTPRELLDDAVLADWSPDGRELAIVRRAPDDTQRIEYPIGHVLVQGPPSAFTALRVSPDGRHVAYQKRASPFAIDALLEVVDSSGKVQRLGEHPAAGYQVAWRGDEEVLFSTSKSGRPDAIRSASLEGRLETVREETRPLQVLDVAADGRMLALSIVTRLEVRCSVAGAAERDLAWYDGSQARALSRDGALLLFDEMLAGGRGGSVWFRPTDGSRLPVQLAEGTAMALSPDASWALVQRARGSAELSLVPTGTGQPRRVPTGSLVAVSVARFTADGRRLILTGRDASDRTGLYALDLDSSGPPRPLGRATLTIGESSPDGTTLATSSIAGPVYLMPAAGGDPRPLAGAEPHDFVLGWTPDGTSVLVASSWRVPQELHRIDVATGTRTRWQSLAPADMAGIAGGVSVVAAADGRSYCYNVHRTLSDLYLLTQ